MNRFLLVSLFLIIGTATTLWAAETDATAKLRELEQQRAKLTEVMIETRIKIIKNDPKLLMLHNQIMAMHKELALQVDLREEMQQLLNKSDELDKKIVELQLQMKK